MRTWQIPGLLFLALACQGNDDDGGQAPAGGSRASGGDSALGGSSTESGGRAAQGGSVSESGGKAQGGATAGSGGKSSQGGASVGGAAPGGGRASQGGDSAAGRSNNGGRKGTGGASNGGATSSGGAASAGAAGCVQNLACKLTAPPSSGDIHQDCVDRVNQFRTQCACMPALERWTAGEACVDQQAQYDSEKNEAHAGFGDGICSAGQSQNECPGYSSNTQVISLCLQQMWDEGPPPTNPCEGSCYQKYGHFINMTSTTIKKVACGFYTTPEGKVWAAQNFSR